MFTHDYAFSFHFSNVAQQALPGLGKGHDATDLHPLLAFDLDGMLDRRPAQVLLLHKMS